MKCIKVISIILLIITIMIGVCGCYMNNTDNSKDNFNQVILTERQKQILSEQGLTTEYDELSSSQKKAIVAIEDMLKYAEEKYNLSFAYAGYIAGNSLEPEQLKVYPLSGDKDEDCFTITKTDIGYEDDYVAIFSTDFFASYVLSGIQELCPERIVKVYAEITSTSLMEVPSVGNDFDGTTEASIWVFVDGEGFEENNFTRFVEDSKNYFTEHKIYSSVQFVLMKTGKIKYVTNSNYEDYLSEDYYISRENVYIKK